MVQTNIYIFGMIMLIIQTEDLNNTELNVFPVYDDRNKNIKIRRYGNKVILL